MDTPIDPHRYCQTVARLAQAESHLIDLTALLSKREYGHLFAKPEVLGAVIYLRRRVQNQNFLKLPTRP